MDIIKHGEAAYPVSAWREYQYRIHGPLCQNQTTGPRLDTRESHDGPQVTKVSSAIAESVSVLNNNVKRGEGEVSGGNTNAGLEISEEIVAEMIEMSENNQEHPI